MYAKLLSKWAFAVLLVFLSVAMVAMPAAAANAAPRHQKLVTCVVSSAAPETESASGQPVPVIVNGIPYTETVRISQVSSTARVYAPSRRCTYRGRSTLITDVTVYKTVLQTPERESSGNTIMVERIVHERTISTAYRHETTGSVSEWRQELLPSQEGVPPVPVVPTGLPGSSEQMPLVCYYDSNNTAAHAAGGAGTAPASGSSSVCSEG